MRILLLVVALIHFSIIQSNAQTVQWASKVIEFSSQLSSTQCSAEQALGKPNVLPSGGESSSAWTPGRPNKKEFLKLGFDNPMSIRQIAIAESYNPSALTRVLVYDENDKEYEILNFIPEPVPLKGMMRNIFIDKTSYKVAAIKLEFEGSAVEQYYSIDAVGIADVDIPVIPEIVKPASLASNIEVERLGENVNSRYAEISPVLSPDGKIMYFGRKNHPENVGGVKDDEDIWYSVLGDDGDWQPAQNLGTMFNNAHPNFINSISAISPDGETLLFLMGNRYLKNGKMLGGISMSTKKGDAWSPPKSLVIENDYNMSDKANFFLTDDRKAIIMSVERKDSYGDRDLYVSFQKKDTLWSEPLNLGPVVNSAGLESAPFLDADNKTLYYSSNGFSGYGGSDIYMTIRLDDTWTNWTEPLNLGPDINSPLEDLFFNIPKESSYAYYSRGITDEDLDIFRVKLPIYKVPEILVAVKGVIRDAKTGEPLRAEVIYERLSDGKRIGVVKPNPLTGEFDFQLPTGEIYGVRADLDGYIAESQNIDLRSHKEGTTYKPTNLSLVPIEEDVVIVLNNVFFLFDKAELTKESFPELDRIAELLVDKSSINIEIAGHTCDMGPSEYNLSLSERRAKAVFNYLTSKGVNSSRIGVVFFGEDKPIVPNTSIDNRKKNRRVEFKILGK